MPRPNLPPTPEALTEIHSKDSFSISVVDKFFNLGPPAIAPKHIDAASTSSRSSQVPTVSTNFALPPPPTRSRTIIQVKPKSQSSQATNKVPSQRSPKSASKKSATGTTMAHGGGKKQPSSTNTAGKKIARKTAHSVIERRRRSKMNEEFATLKSMIPACTDQEMHKLAILQASIDYLRYLEKCIVDLRNANTSLSTPPMQPQAPHRHSESAITDDDDDGEVDGSGDGEEDITMENAAMEGDISPVFSAIRRDEASYQSPQSVTPSPALDAQSYYHTSSYSSSVSILPSPAFKPRTYEHGGSISCSSLSASNSPVTLIGREKDQEAMDALMMLNKDRRHSKAGRGMSVKDLLSS